MRRLTWAVAALLLAGAGTGTVLGYRYRATRTARLADRRRVESLQRERDTLQAHLSALLARDHRLVGMPTTPIRIGIPTSLARDLVERVVAGLLDQVTLSLGGMRVQRSGTIRKVLTLGDWSLEIVVDHVTATLRTQKPDVRFGGDVVRVSLPVELARGSGSATVHFRWDGRRLGGAVCGDMAITREVNGTLAPVSVPARGSLHLAASANRIVATPRFPPTSIHLLVRPSEESWRSLDDALEAKRGVCGFVLDRVDIRKAVEHVVARGFVVRLPTERLGPMGLPIAVEPSITVRGQPLAIAIRLAHLTITEEMIWLGPEIDIRNLSSATTPWHRSRQ